MPRSWPSSQQLANGLAAVGAVVEGALVHIHAHKAAGQARVQVTRKLHRVFQCLFAVVEGVLDRIAQRLGDDLVRFSAERAADGVAAKRQHKAGSLAPPDAQVENLIESAGRVGELPLVDDESGIVLSRLNRGNDLIEGNGLGLDGRVEDFEREISRGQRSGNSDADAAEVAASILRLETTMGP